MYYYNGPPSPNPTYHTVVVPDKRGQTKDQRGMGCEGTWQKRMKTLISQCKKKEWTEWLLFVTPGHLCRCAFLFVCCWPTVCWFRRVVCCRSGRSSRPSSLPDFCCWQLESCNATPESKHVAIPSGGSSIGPYTASSMPSVRISPGTNTPGWQACVCLLTFWWPWWYTRAKPNSVAHSDEPIQNGSPGHARR